MTRTLRSTLPISLTLVVVLFTGGCKVDPATLVMPESQTPTPRPVRVPEFTVVGVDRSGSFKLKEESMALCRQLVQNAQAGDTLIFRWIAESSYRNDQEFCCLTVPTPSAEPKTPGVFNKAEQIRYERALKAQREAHETAVRAVRGNALAAINNAEIKKAMKTDIIGFLVAASELFEQAPRESEKILVVVSDMLDEGIYKAETPLPGVEVIAYLQNDPDPAKMQKRRESWTNRFQTSGCSNVEFRSINGTIATIGGSR